MITEYYNPNNKINIGDTVIIYPHKLLDNDYREAWINNMWEYVGKQATVISTSTIEPNSVYLDIDQCAHYWYTYCLKKITFNLKIIGEYIE